ncbi:MAG TPA: sodium:solute symporter family protein [Calditrichia bacterium]|nr:sodium:solute symporter family protein [Calditrichota bacterium]HQU71051.1 sodium:solute symporter family protein [Calditrichia bacterium]HQV30453.1 sodium:solute symporter family protein [Calditrichia bacterium]
MNTVATTHHWLYWLAFLGYSALVIGMGLVIYFRERHKAPDTRQFWSANANLSGWSVGLSISASMMSISWSCVYGVQLFYWYGTGAAWLLIIPWLLTMAGFWIFAPRFRRLQAFSQPELLGKRFGLPARQLLAPALIFVFIVWGGAEIYAAGITIAPFLGVSVETALLLIALVVAAYSFTGGFEAVVSTDKIQFALVALFITIMAIVAVTAAGDADLAAAALTAPKASPDQPNFFSPGWVLILLTLVAYLPGWLVETDVWIRMQAGRDDRQARRGIFLAGFNSFVFVGIMPLLIGLAALALYPPDGGTVHPRLADGSLIFSVLMQDFTPAWLSVVLGVGLVAAAMSTVDTCGNVVALSAAYDLAEPHLQHKWSPHQLQKMARWASVGAIALALLYALFTDSLWDIFYLSSGILSTTVFLPVVGAFRKNTRPAQVTRAAVAGFLGTLIAYFLEAHGPLGQWEPQWLSQTGLGYILVGMGCSIAGFFFPSKN